MKALHVPCYVKTKIIKDLEHQNQTLAKSIKSCFFYLSPFGSLLFLFFVFFTYSYTDPVYFDKFFFAGFQSLPGKPHHLALIVY